MQSDTRIAFPYLLVPSIQQHDTGKVHSSRIALHLRSILPDLLLVWNAVSFLVAGIVAAKGFTAYTSLPSGVGHLRDSLIEAAAFGAVLSLIFLPARTLRRSNAILFKGLLQRVAGLIGLTLLLLIVVRSAPVGSWLWAAGWFAAVVPMVLAGRGSALWVLHQAARRFGGERVAVVGKGAEAEWLRGALRQATQAGIDLVPQNRRAGSLDGVVADLVEQGRHGVLDRVILAQPGLSDHQVQHLAHRLKALQVEVASLFPLAGAGSVRPTAELADIPLFVIARRPQWGYGGLTKQALDRGLALLLLLWTAPVLLMIGLAVWVDSPGPVLFRQRRQGLNGVEFDIYKFRTMVWQGQEAGTGAVQTGRNDRRVTRIGGWLRRSSLDEVPQLLNVLNGTMSLVGPRPHPTMMRTEERLGDEITPEYPHRHRVKPGITGWAQVSGLRGATETAEQLRRRIEHDNFYIENWSPWFDLQILAMTPVSLLFRRGNAF